MLKCVSSGAIIVDVELVVVVGDLYPVVGETEVAVVADDDVVEEGDVKRVGGLFYALGLR